MIAPETISSSPRPPSRRRASRTGSRSRSAPDMAGSWTWCSAPGAVSSEWICRPFDRPGTGLHRLPRERVSGPGGPVPAPVRAQVVPAHLLDRRPAPHARHPKGVCGHCSVCGTWRPGVDLGLSPVGQGERRPVARDHVADEPPAAVRLLRGQPGPLFADSAPFLAGPGSMRSFWGARRVRAGPSACACSATSTTCRRPTPTSMTSPRSFAGSSRPVSPKYACFRDRRR